MDSAPVSSIVSLSIPIPMPPAGGIPCSRASRNSSSIFCLSSPACSSRRWRCTSGSFSSLYPGAISAPLMTSSKTSTSELSSAFCLASDLSSFGHASQTADRSFSLRLSLSQTSACVTSKSASCGRISSLNSSIARSRRCSGVNSNQSLPATFAESDRGNARGATAI